MSQEAKDRLVFIILLAMKFLTTLRTGLDTYAVSNDLLNVMLLDGVFLALWMVLAYGGKGQTAMAIRPFAAVGSYVMYGFMLIIGWEAHVDSPIVALAVRIAGALVLLYDTWDFAIAWYQRQVDQRGKTLAEQQRNLREKIWRKAYESAARQLNSDFETQSKALLLADIEADTDYRQSLPILPPVRKQLSAGQVQKERSETFQERSQNDLERDIDVSRPSIKRRWDTVYPMLPDNFTRKDVEELGKCAKTQAFEVIAYGKHLGLVKESGERGIYQKSVIVEGEVAEDNQGF